MTVLVTGASGFVGGAVVRALADHGVAVRAMVRDTSSVRFDEPGADVPTRVPVEVVAADLRDHVAVARAVFDTTAVVHAAALLGESGRASDFFETNVAGTDTLLQEAEAAGVRRFVFLGSPSALMDPRGGDQLDIDESVPYPATFLNSYCETKAVAEQLVLAANTPFFTTCSLRPRAVWGPGDRGGPVPQILLKLRGGRLPDLSGGRPVTASLCYIDHLVQAVRAALTAENIGGRSYFVADAEPVPVWPTLARVAEEFGLAPPSRAIPAGVVTGALSVIETIRRLPGVAERWTPPLSRYAVALVTRSATYDTGAARRDLGFDPRVSFDDGLRAYHRWVDDQGGLDVLLEGL
ncbi:NAD-dependent epimerase/dehydratase family protein [Nocardia thailandica]|uniref:NAD-dependent epimerase/dehydratase family protein n=1 Tax=Nocardia thailandica TaxID=257275 RepID=UPI0003037069|nr:NAD-dependent epimerase/dehydratase family protein [Nocardia thailandica]